MVGKSVVLVSNPVSNSRNYAVFAGDICRGQVSFRCVGNSIECTLIAKNEKHTFEVRVGNIDSVIALVLPLLEKYKIIDSKSEIDKIGIKVTAPSSYFLKNREVNQDVIEHLKTIVDRSPSQIKPIIKEIKYLKLSFPRVKMIAVSDSAFHARKPDKAWNYGINLHDADRLDIKRFGYHGLAMQSITEKLKNEYKLPAKLVVCHVGMNVSVTAIKEGNSQDNTFGFSMLDGPIMSTKSGNIDPTAVLSLKSQLGLKDKTVDQYLNNKSGLLGLSGKYEDIKELLAIEHENHQASLAIETYIYNIQKSIGQMAASLNGCDALVFTGSIGIKSPTIRKKIINELDYLRFIIDTKANKSNLRPNNEISAIHLAKHSKPIYIIKSDEEEQIAKSIIK